MVLSITPFQTAKTLLQGMVTTSSHDDTCSSTPQSSSPLALSGDGALYFLPLPCILRPCWPCSRPSPQYIHLEASLGSTGLRVLFLLKKKESMATLLSLIYQACSPTLIQGHYAPLYSRPSLSGPLSSVSCIYRPEAPKPSPILPTAESATQAAQSRLHSVLWHLLRSLTQENGTVRQHAVTPNPPA